MDERYEFRVQGFLGPVLRVAFGGMRCETAASNSTIRGRLSPDQLHAMLARLDRHGVVLLQVQCQHDAPVTAGGDGSRPARPHPSG